MFIDNKYTRWYHSIIGNAKKRITEGYSEKHHIIPKSMGGLDNIDNLVSLTAREHYIVHLLLTKMVEGDNLSKMAFAFRMMNVRSKTNQRDHKVNSRLFESVKKNLNYKRPQSKEDTQKRRNAARKMWARRKGIQE